MADVDELFNVFGDSEAPSEPVTSASPPDKQTPNKEQSFTEVLKRRRVEAKESHGEETKKLKMAIVDELR